MERTCHISVMPSEVLEYLQADKGGQFLDCTLGGAGHAMAILKANKDSSVTAIDRDARAVIRANRKLEEFEGRVKIMHGSFSSLKEVLAGERFDGVLADLGISTDQLKENRGFSFNDKSELDMRMDESEDISAHSIVNKSTEKDLRIILKQGGVGREANILARAIMQARPIDKTEELSKVINVALAGKRQSKKTNPSTVVFQAIRIAVNREFEEIEALLNAAPHLVKPGGRLAVITFHSLEDKIVAKKMRAWESQGSYPALWRGARKEKSLGKNLSRKAIEPQAKEIQANPSSRSAKLRVFQFNS